MHLALAVFSVLLVAYCLSWHCQKSPDPFSLTNNLLYHTEFELIANFFWALGIEVEVFARICSGI